MSELFTYEGDEVANLLNEQQDTIERLKKRLDYETRMHKRWKDDCLAILEEKKNDNGGFQVWEVPPIPKGKRISFTTNNDGGDGL